VKTFTTTCDRCGTIVSDRLSVLVVKHGVISRQFDDPVDLCEPCGSSFLSWLKSGRQTGLPTLGAAPVGVVRELDTITR
jgi:hypothetical protein